jgi:hypothetical protein
MGTFNLKMGLLGLVLLIAVAPGLCWAQLEDSESVEIAVDVEPIFAVWLTEYDAAHADNDPLGPITIDLDETEMIMDGDDDFDTVAHRQRVDNVGDYHVRANQDWLLEVKRTTDEWEPVGLSFEIKRDGGSNWKVIAGDLEELTSGGPPWVENQDFDFRFSGITINIPPGTYTETLIFQIRAADDDM